MRKTKRGLIIAGIALAALSACTAFADAPTNTPITTPTEAEIVAACTATINQYAHYRDQLDAEGYANLFTEDSVFVFPGITLTGREAIARRIRDDDGTTSSRHLTGSIVVSVDDDQKITARSYIHVYQAATPDTPGPVPASKYILGEYHDDMRMTASGCKIARRETVVVFISDM